MRVTVLGSINVDTILPVPALPGPGETVLAGDSVRLPGGKGANQAVAAARMGAEVAMIGAVGMDADGDWMAGLLAADGVDTTALHRVEAATGAATIAVDRDGENLIIVAPGANARLMPEHLPALGVGPLLAQLEVPVATIAAAFARAEGLRILNAAPAIAEAMPLFAECDLLIVNEHELVFYSGAGADEAAARSLIAREGQAVVVTLGAVGALAVWEDRALHVPALPVTPVDTVGAGDCFCGALAALLAEGATLEAALPRANAAAALCTLTAGAAPAMPRRAAVEALARSATYHAPAIKTPGPVAIDWTRA